MSVEELSGWVGAILVLIAYYMVSSGKAKAESTGFQVINIIGASSLIYYTYSCQAYASMAVNIIWVGIGLNSTRRYMNLNAILKQIPKLSPGSQNMKLKTKLICAIACSIFVITVSANSIAQDSEESTIAQVEISAEEDEETVEDTTPVTSDESSADTDESSESDTE